MHNRLPETSIHDVVEHIGNFRFGNAIRDMTDPRSPSEINFGNRTVEQSNTPKDTNWNWDNAERTINVLAPLIIGPILIEFGLSRWHRRKFQWKNLISIFSIVWGISMFFKMR